MGLWEGRGGGHLSLGAQFFRRTATPKVGAEGGGVQPVLNP